MMHYLMKRFFMCNVCILTCLALFIQASGDSRLLDKVCDPAAVSNGCGADEYCDFDAHRCSCNRDFVLQGGQCVTINQSKDGGSGAPNSSSLRGESDSGHLVATVALPILLISLIIVAIYFGQKFKAFSKFQSWWRKKKYDEFIIGGEGDDDDDDPPLH